MQCTKFGLKEVRMNKVVIVAAKRTPIGSFMGGLSTVPATVLGSKVISAALDELKLNPSIVDEVFMGHVLQAGTGQAPARQAALGAGIPNTVPCSTINKVCASGMKAITLGIQAIALGDAEVVIAGGMENMSLSPHLSSLRQGQKFGNITFKDGIQVDGLTDAYEQVAMGVFADACATEYAISRESQDAFAIESYRRSAQAWENGSFDAEVIEVAVPQRKGDPIIVSQDEEFKNVIDLVLYVFSSLGFENFTTQISLRDINNKEKYIGSDEVWETAEKAIINATKEKDIKYKIVYGEAAFYGPKLDFMVKDALGREWQLGTIQVDYNLPERFELCYVDSQNNFKRPVMIHRAPFGSMERFIAILIEHTGGNFPLWLTSDQVILIPVGEKHKKYTEKVLKLLENDEIRALADTRNETVGKKIREAELNKIPFMIIIGDKEIKNNMFSVRGHGGKDYGEKSVKELSKFINDKSSEIIKDFN